MSETSPIWPARLDHICISTEQPDEMLAFYGDAMGYQSAPLDTDLWQLSGHQRTLLLTTGKARQIGFVAFWLDDADRLAQLRESVAAKGEVIENSTTPLFKDDAFAVSDPDGTQLVFGLSAYKEAKSSDALPAELQHYAVTTKQISTMAKFYGETLGMRLSDQVFDDQGDPTANFFRSDASHHVIALFGAAYSELDHHSYELPSWNDIRDWADHFGDRRIPLWWGPGRHGPGNNLFFMIQDPDDNKLEFSTELEIFDYAQAPRTWPHEEHTLNLWGGAWMRDD